MAQGAQRLAGGSRVGAVVPPTLLTISTAACGSVAAKFSAGDLHRTIRYARRGHRQGERYSLRARKRHLHGAARQCLSRRAPARWPAASTSNETSSARVDMMPYGGSKDSGFGREGPRYAIREMTEERVVSIST